MDNSSFTSCLNIYYFICNIITLNFLILNIKDYKHYQELKINKKDHY